MRATREVQRPFIDAHVARVDPHLDDRVEGVDVQRVLRVCGDMAHRAQHEADATQDEESPQSEEENHRLAEEALEPLWEEKVAFMCKGGGKGLAGEMHKLKDFAPSVQAAVWRVLGSNAPNTGEQLNGMLKAVDCLATEPFAKVKYLIALAQWLYTHSFPLRDADDQLVGAIDILMDFEDIPDTADDDDDGLSSCVPTMLS